MVLTTSLVSAEIVFKEKFNDFNLGDSVSIEGWIEEDEDVPRGTFKMYLDCGSSRQLSVKTFNVEANKRYSFDEDVILFGGYKGECNFRVTFNGDSKSSEKFKIVDDLEGNVFVNKDSFNLGDIFKVSGDIFKVNRDRLSEGTGIIYLGDNEEYILVDTFEVYDGNVDYSIVLEKIPSGDYDLNLEVIDGFGNKGTFDIGSIEIKDSLYVDLTLDKENYLPGDELWINGDVDANNYKVSFKINDETFGSSFEDRKFDFSLKLKDNIKSGPNTIGVTVGDEYGNYYEEDLNFDVTAIPTGLNIKVNEKHYLPGETVEIFAKVFDQADDVYSDNINLRVLNPKKNEILKVDVGSGTTVYGLELEANSIPGNYKIIAKSLDFKREVIFIVDELIKIDAYYDGNKLKIVNDGNIPINGEINIYLDDEVLLSNLKLKPSEIESYLLGRHVSEDGSYNVVVSFNGEEYEVGDVYIERMGFIPGITGAVIGGSVSDWIIYVVIFIIIILVLVYFIYKPDKKVDMNRERDFREGQAKLKERRAERDKKKPRKLFPAKNISESEAKQFRESMVQRMKEK